MARDAYSVVRSLSRHVALILGEDWGDVRPADMEGGFERPYALVEQVTGQAVSGGTIVRDVIVPFTVSVFPASHEDHDESWRQMMMIADRLEDGFNTDLHSPGHICRVPLYDYTGIPMDASTDKRAHCDYLRVSNPVAINPVRDPDDPRLWMIAVDLRCGYRRLGRIPFSGRTATEVTWAPDVAVEP